MHEICTFPLTRITLRLSPCPAKFCQFERTYSWNLTEERIQQTVDVIDATHPSTSMLPAEWHVQDEAYVRLFD